MTDEQYEAIKRQFTPHHLTADGRRPVNRFQQLEDAVKAERVAENSRLDRLIDRAYKRFGVSSGALVNTIYMVAFRKRYGIWPEAGADYQAVDYVSLDRLHEACLRIVYRPEDIGGDERTQTIYDYTGIGPKGKPELFSAFVNRLMDNRYRSARRQAFRDKNKEVGIQLGEPDDDDNPLEKGYMFESQFSKHAAVPEDGPLNDKALPGELCYQIHMLKVDFQYAHSAIAHAFLNLGISSAAEIARLVKSGDLKFWADRSECKTPKDKERISEILKNFKRQIREVFENYVLEHRERIAAEYPEFASELLDPAGIEKEARRVAGMVPRTGNPVGFKKAKRTKEEELGFNTYAIAGGHSDY